jgi:hypothetical protein
MNLCMVFASPASQRKRSKHGHPIQRELPDSLPGQSLSAARCNCRASELPQSATRRRFNRSTAAERLPEFNCIQSIEYLAEANIPELLRIELLGARLDVPQQEMAPFTRLNPQTWIRSRSLAFRAAAPRWVLWM